MTNLEAFLHILGIRNGWAVEFPLHGSINEVFVRHKSEEYQVCIILRAHATDPQQQSADLEAIQDLKA